MAGGKHLLGKPKGKHIFGTAKVGEKDRSSSPRRRGRCSACSRAIRF